MPDTMTDAERVRVLATKLMGWKVEDRSPGIRDVHPFYEWSIAYQTDPGRLLIWPHYGAYASAWNPLTNRDHLAECEQRLTPEQRGAYCAILMAEVIREARAAANRGELLAENPAVWGLLTLPPAVRAGALVEIISA